MSGERCARGDASSGEIVATAEPANRDLDIRVEGDEVTDQPPVFRYIAGEAIDSATYV